MIIEKLFSNVLQMSFYASLIICIVLILRMFFKKLPKIYAYFLWIIVFFRLLCPFTIDSVFSIMPDSVRYEPRVTTGYAQTEPLHYYAYEDVGDEAYVSETLEYGLSKEENRHMFWDAAEAIWIAGVFAVLIKVAAEVVRVKSIIKPAKNLYDNVFECENIPGPFLFGIAKPCIYLPSGLTEKEKRYVIMHEYEHIKRFDNIVKPLAFTAVALHWFNPLVWLGYWLFSKDVEMCVDESTCRDYSIEEKKEYSLTLLSLSMKQSGFFAAASFVESNTKARVKNIHGFKKPKILAAALAVAAISLTACTMLTNKKDAVQDAGNAVYENMQETQGLYMFMPKQLYGNDLPIIVEASIVNESGKDYWYTDSNYLEIMKDGKWERLEPVEDKGNDIMNPLPGNSGGDTVSLNKFEADLSGMYGKKLIDGRYRIGRHVVDSSGNGSLIYAYFYIGDGNVLWGEEVLNSVAENRTNYIGDNVRVSHIVGVLPTPYGIKHDGGTELQTSYEPYELKAFYSERSGYSTGDILNSDIWFKNAAILFSAVENMGKCTFIISDEYGGVTSYSYNRDEFEEIFGRLFDYSKDAGRFSALLNEINSYLGNNYGNN